MEENKKQNRTKERIKTILIIVLTIIIILLLLRSCYGNKNTDDNNAITTDLQVNEVIDEMTDEEKQAYVDKIVEDSMLNINYSPYASFDTNGNSTSFLVRNIEQNNDSIKFTLYDENGEIIYESSEIKLGYQCEKITLNKPLSVGQHSGTISISYVTGGSIANAFPITLEVIE